MVFFPSSIAGYLEKTQWSHRGNSSKIILRSHYRSSPCVQRVMNDDCFYRSNGSPAESYYQNLSALMPKVIHICESARRLFEMPALSESVDKSSRTPENVCLVLDMVVQS